jgi:hypothetical protein
MIRRIGLIGGWFQHAYSSTLWKRPTYFEWSKGKQEELTFFVDEQIVPQINNKTNKIAWVVESSSIIPNIIEDIIHHAKEISESYTYLFTHDKRIYDLADNFIYITPHGYWIKEPKIYKKNKLVSMISSAKRMCPGHNYRLSWVNRLRNKLDLYGTGFNRIKRKEEALVDYMFSVTIENSQYATYWTEKILDCFTTGTIPIYHGSPDIAQFFDSKGIIILNDNFKISDLSIDLYESMCDSIEKNFKIALQYDIIEDILYTRYLKDIID